MSMNALQIKKKKKHYKNRPFKLVILCNLKIDYCYFNL